MFRNNFVLPSLLMVAWAVSTTSVAADAMTPDAAWKALPKYEYGHDMAALLTIDREVILAMKTPESRAACAAKLAALLTSTETTAAARQYACLQLRQVGGPAQVPPLASLLLKTETSQAALFALASIPGDESLAAVRNAMGQLQGVQLIGAINAVANRKDSQSVVKLQELADSKDAPVAAASLWALGNIADEPARAFLIQRAEKAGVPTPQSLATPLMRCADAAAAAGNTKQAQAIYAKLSGKKQAVPVRLTALDGQLRLLGDRAKPTIVAWFSGNDPQQRMIAAGQLGTLADKELDVLLSRWTTLPESSQFVLFNVLGQRKATQILPMAIAAAKSDKPEVRLTGIRLLGIFGDATAIPLLIERLADGGPVTVAAQQAITRLPQKEACDALLAAVKQRGKACIPAAASLASLKCYEAIDPLIAMVDEQKPGTSLAAVEAIREIADPDDADISRLVALYGRLPQGTLHDQVERAIVLVCLKLPANADRAEPVLKAVDKLPAAEGVKYLPLLGRLGGEKVAKKIDAGMQSSDSVVKQAALLALCNWPNADMAERLWNLSAQSDDKASAQAALRAYVRVVSLKGKRPDAETLVLLQKAMQRAVTAEDKQWILTRASAVRTLATVDWLATYLDDASLNQAACKSIVELAHHRFLRHPNMAKFSPILEKVSQTSKDPIIVERAKKYRLGL
jgi:HEAT repeat protein